MWALRSKIPAAASCALVLLAGSSAWAGNGLHPRTRVVWTDTACMEIVDRTVDSVYMLEYDIPFEDTEVTADEVEDSRTHQFFAFCRQHSPQHYLPSWITQADVDAAIAKDLINEGVVEDQDILELSTSWAGCWDRVNEDADRRPIIYEMADEPVPWETADLPVGTYYLEGYTYEPAFNMWTPRQGGVIKVIDGGDPADIGPSAAVTTLGQNKCVGEMVPIEGCVDALPGSTMTAYYGITTSEGAGDPNWEPDWVPFVEDLEVEGDTFSLDWVAPQEVGGESVMIRLDVTDPMDRTYTAYQFELNVILPAGSPGCSAGTGGCEGTFIMDPECGGTGDGSTSDGGDTSSTGTSGEAGTSTGMATTGTDTAPGSGDDGGGGGGGCACTSGERSRDASGWLVLGLLGVLGLGRRRRRA